MKKIAIPFIIILIFLATTVCGQMGRGMMGGTSRPLQQPNMSYTDRWFDEQLHLVRGGQLYDDWWRTTVDTVKPSNDHPIWKKQSSNKRNGYSTYRCKECHGWDYRGKDGAYSKGSHYTGFIGVYEASEKMSIIELVAALKGSTNKNHDFIRYLSEGDISDMALFMLKGLIDTRKFVDTDGTPVGGNIRTGNYLFERNCTHMCHGGSGTGINFGDSEKPEFVGTVAYKNPWEFVHKVRTGQPGARMPSAILNEWSDKDILDLLSFARTLPRDVSEIGWLTRLGRGMMGFGMHRRDFAPGKGRGFGPSLE